MAIYHFHVTQISRGKGQTAVSAAAYRAGERLHDTYYGEEPDYTEKTGVVYTEIMLTEHAPREYADRETLWNAVEYAEANPKAQLAYSFDFALPNELTDAENRELARGFVAENFTSGGMISDMVIHNLGKHPGNVPNPHVHVMVPMRPLNERSCRLFMKDRRFVRWRRRESGQKRESGIVILNPSIEQSRSCFPLFWTFCRQSKN